MGDQPSKFEQPLNPQPQPLWIVNPRFCLPQQVTLRLKEKIFSWSGDDFKIQDPYTKQTWFSVQGRAFSLREKKSLMDVYGTPVLNIKDTIAFFEPNYKSPVYSVHPSYYPDEAITPYKVYLGNDSSQLLFELRARITFAKAKASTQIVNRHNGQPMLLVMKGNIWSHEAMIYIGEPKMGGVPIARISRPMMTTNELLFDKQTYHLTIAPNVDISMAVAICICLDEMKKDK